MAADRSYVSVNDRERHRLEELVDKLDDKALSRPMPAGWTVASVLAHLAFWDERIILLIELLKRGASIPVENPVDVEWINDAAKPAQLALPPRRAATLAVETARATDRAVAALSDDLLAKNAAAGSPINLLRAEHRREHLDEIEQVLRQP
jgi:Mycothiol maleylpyruvate isomerase N-terminal domain